MGIPVQPVNHGRTKLWLGLTLSIGVLCCIAIGISISANINAQSETSSDAIESVGLFEGMPSKHRACRNVNNYPLKSGIWANRWCLGWVECSGNGLVTGKGNCEDGKVFNGKECVHKVHEGDPNCAQCKKPGCRKALYSR